MGTPYQGGEGVA
jgi:hypothetical protein